MRLVKSFRRQSTRHLQDVIRRGNYSSEDENPMLGSLIQLLTGDSCTPAMIGNSPLEVISTNTEPIPPAMANHKPVQCVKSFHAPKTPGTLLLIKNNSRATWSKVVQ